MIRSCSLLDPFPCPPLTRFGIKAPAAKTILREVFTAVSAWRRTAVTLRLKTTTLNTYASAFEHERVDEARSLLAK
jgi:hypothetical protein